MICTIQSTVRNSW